MLTSYHLKTVLFWKCETKPPEYWENVQPLDFSQEILKDLEDCLDNETIKHFFVPDCNIFPFHKMCKDNVTQMKQRFETMKKEMINAMIKMISFDLNVDDESFESCTWIALKHERATTYLTYTSVGT